MTAGKFFKVLFVVGALLFAIFVWPTRYKYYPGAPDEDGVAHPMRVDRITQRVDVQTADGRWEEFVPPPPSYDAKDTPTGHAVRKAERAGEDIRKMNDVAKDAVNQGTLGQ